jgi:hypothetical protein
MDNLSQVEVKVKCKEQNLLWGNSDTAKQAGRWVLGTSPKMTVVSVAAVVVDVGLGSRAVSTPVHTAHYAGIERLKDHELLPAIDGVYDVLVTHQVLPQQQPAGRRLALSCWPLRSRCRRPRSRSCHG